MKTVSVIIPTLNEELGIAAAIVSAKIAGATEVLVVDGGSHDATVRIARQSGAEVLTGTIGRAAQQNAGAAAAAGDVLLFLHGDCRLHPEAIDRLRHWLDQSDQNIAGGFAQCIDDPRWRFRLVESGNGLRIRIFGWVYGDQGIFLSRQLFHKVGGFPQLTFMEDLFLSRILKTRGRIGLIDAPICVSARRWQRIGLVRQTLRNWWLVARALAGRSPDDLAKHYPNAR